MSSTTALLPKTNILVLGIDSAFGHRSDTIMVLHTDPENKEAFLISIPRDSLVDIPGRGLDKINHAYAYGGVELTKKTIENLFSVQIPYYIIVDLAGIVRIIDELGGVTINVDKRMYYVDYAGDLYVDLYPGRQVLNGKQVMGYLRYRHDGGDFKRINRQQEFLSALANELMKKDNLVRTPKLFLTLLSNLDSNLDSKETLGLALGVRSAQELGNVHMTTLPGSDLMLDGVYYWKIDEMGLKNIVKEYIYQGKPNQS